VKSYFGNMIWPLLIQSSPLIKKFLKIKDRERELVSFFVLEKVSSRE